MCLICFRVLLDDVKVPRSFGPLESGNIGRKFMQSSILISTVISSSKDSSDDASWCTSRFLAIFEAASQRPPKARSEIRCHYIVPIIVNTSGKIA